MPDSKANSTAKTSEGLIAKHALIAADRGKPTREVVAAHATAVAAALVAALGEDEFERALIAAVADGGELTREVVTAHIATDVAPIIAAFVAALGEDESERFERALIATDSNERAREIVAAYVGAFLAILRGDDAKAFEFTQMASDGGKVAREVAAHIAAVATALGEDAKKTFEGLTARQHADRAALHAERALVAANGGNRDRALACAHVGAAVAALAKQEGNDLLCRGVIHSAQARLAGSMEDNDSSETADNALLNDQQALSLFERAHDEPRATGARANLGIAYLRLRSGSEEANVQQAIYHLEKALTKLPKGGAAWIDVMGNLASAYQRRKIGTVAQNLARAISCIRDALAHVDRAVDPERWGDLENNLGNVLHKRARDDDDRREAIAHYTAGLDATERERFPRQWADLHSNLSRVLGELSDGDATAQLDQAIEHLRLALEVYTPLTFPGSHLETQRALGHKLMRAERFEEAHEVFAGAIAVERILFARAFTWQGRQVELERSGPLFFRDAYCLVRLCRLDEALVRLEEGRARVLNEAISILDAGSLAGSDTMRIAAAQELVRRLEAEHLALASRAPARHRPRIALELQAARDALVEAVESLRPERSPGRLLSSQALLAMIPPTGLVVAPIVTDIGTAVFVIPGGTSTLREDHALRLDAFTIDNLHHLLVGDEGWLPAYQNRKEQPDRWRRTIMVTCRRLWDVLIAPVEARARSLGLAPGGDVILVCPGLLGILPVHAAMHSVGDVERCFSDDFVVSCAPSIAVLASSVRRAQAIPRVPASVLAVLHGTKDLRFASAEGELVLAQFKPSSRRRLRGRKATSDQIFHKAGSVQYLHFACHGRYDPSGALRSSLQFANGELTLQDIIAHLALTRARLVVLSACETGFFEIRRAAEEQLGLRSGFLQAGAAAVVSSLWPVNDAATMLLMDYFYQLHLEGMSPADALGAAQRWLRTATNDDLAGRMQELRTATGGRKANAIDEQFQRFALARDGKEIPFNHPYYWAAFVVDGA